MQTNFSLAQLADADTAEAERILRSCVHCGFCTATCPTFALRGDERDSPRGRIYLIKDMLEGGKPASATVVRHVDRCLSCLSCMTTCPSSVHYMHLVDHARNHIARTWRRPLLERLQRTALQMVLPHAGRFRLAVRLAALAQPFRALVPARLRPMLDLAPRRLAPANAQNQPGVFAAGARRKRVALLAGCVQPALRPEINAAAVQLLNRFGVEVVIARGTGCCGALTHHMGNEAAALAAARANVDAWCGELAGDGLDAIIVTASGCGTVVKDYGFMLRHDPAYADKAARISALARDVTEVLAELDLPPVAGAGLRVAYHAACSLQHGQRIRDVPKQLLRRAGFTVLDVPEAHLCCGSAGTYNILQPELAGELRARKLANIASTSPQAVAAGNIGCLTQLADGAGVPVLHTVELLDWAYGGACPATFGPATG